VKSLFCYSTFNLYLHGKLRSTIRKT